MCVLEARADQKLGVASFSEQDLSQMSFNQLQVLRSTYIQFIQEESKQKHASHFHFDLIQAATAAGLQGDQCYIGGWPSQIEAGLCKKPEQMTSSKNCTDGTSECNPGLFPASKVVGACVPTKTRYADFTNVCAEASKDHLDDLKKNLDHEKMAALSQSVKQFCDANSGYDACASLATRLQELMGGELIGNYVASPAEPAAGQHRGSRAAHENPTPPTTAGSGDHTPDPGSVGDQILNDCKKYLENQKLSASGQIFASCDSAGSMNLQNRQAFETLIGDHTKLKLANELVADGMKQNLLALVVTEVQYSGSQIPHQSSGDLSNYLKQKYPDLAKNSGFSDVVNDAFAKISSAQKKGAIKPVDQNHVAAQFNTEAKKANEVCTQIHKDFEAKIGAAHSTAQLIWDNPLGRRLRKAHAASDFTEFYNQSRIKMSAALNELQKNSTASPMMGTDYFKKNVFDPTLDYGRICSEYENHVLVKSNVETSEIAKGAEGIHAVLGASLAKLNEQQKKIAGGDPSKAQGVVEDFLKNDQALVNHVLKKENPAEQKESAGLVCTTLESKLRSDVRWHAIDVGVGIVGGIAGGILTLSGIGAPIGIPITVITGSMVVAGVAGGHEAIRGAVKISNASDLNRNISSQMASNSELSDKTTDTSNFTDSIRSTKLQKQNGAAQVASGALTLAGLAPGVRALNAARVANSSRAVSAVDTSLPELGSGGGAALKISRDGASTTVSAVDTSLPALGSGNPASKLLGTGSSVENAGASTENTATQILQKRLGDGAKVVNKRGQQAAKGATTVTKGTTNDPNPSQVGATRVPSNVPPAHPYTVPQGYNMEKVSNLYGAMNEAAVAISKGRQGIAATRVSSIMETVKDFGGKQNYLNYLRSVGKGDEAIKAEALLNKFDQFQAK